MPGEGAPMIDVQTHFVVLCPRYSAGLRVPRAYLGQKVRCNHCAHAFVAEEGPGTGGVISDWTTVVTLFQADRILVTYPSGRSTCSTGRADLGQGVRCERGNKAVLDAGPAGRSPLPEPPPDRPGDKF